MGKCVGLLKMLKFSVPPNRMVEFCWGTLGMEIKLNFNFGRNLDAVYLLGFDRMWILTIIRRLRELIMYPRTKFQRISTICG